MVQTDEVVLVNEWDVPIGVMEKMEAHRKPQLHRAFSVFLFNTRGEMLIQQRAFSKYHSGGLWTNACCSHPRPGEETLAAANRRVKEELGITTNLGFAFHFTYQAAFDNGLYEYEFDHVFTGIFEGELHLNPEEVAACKYISLNALEQDIQEHPQAYTAWFKIALPRLTSFLQNHPIIKF